MRDPDHRPGGSPRKRARKAAQAMGEAQAGESRVHRERNTKITPEVIARIATLVRAGNFLETACAAAGITRPTMRAWLERGGREHARLLEGEEPDPESALHLEFMLAYTEAQGSAIASDVAIISRAGRDYENETTEYDGDGKVIKRVHRTERGDWRALAWRLEHMHGDQFTMRVKVEVESQLDDMLDFLEQNVPPESFRHVVEALAKRASA